MVSSLDAKVLPANQDSWGWQGRFGYRTYLYIPHSPFPLSLSSASVFIQSIYLYLTSLEWKVHEERALFAYCLQGPGSGMVPSSITFSVLTYVDHMSGFWVNMLSSGMAWTWVWDVGTEKRECDDANLSQRFRGDEKGKRGARERKGKGTQDNDSFCKPRKIL